MIPFLKLLGLVASLLAAALLLLCVGILLGRAFPNLHVSGNKHLRRRGIGCVQHQDLEARRKNKLKA